MNEPHSPATSDPDGVDPRDEQPPVMGLLAERCRMTEGQLYTAILAVAVAVLLTVTGLPTAQQRSDADAISGGVPVLAPTTTAQEAP